MIVAGCRKRPLVTVQRQERDGQYQWGLGEKAKFITKPAVEAWPVVNEILNTKQKTTVLMLRVREEQTTSRGAKSRQLPVLVTSYGWSGDGVMGNRESSK